MVKQSTSREEVVQEVTEKYEELKELYYHELDYDGDKDFGYLTKDDAEKIAQDRLDLSLDNSEYEYSAGGLEFVISVRPRVSIYKDSFEDQIKLYTEPNMRITATYNGYTDVIHRNNFEDDVEYFIKLTEEADRIKSRDSQAFEEYQVISLDPVTIETRDIRFIYDDSQTQILRKDMVSNRIFKESPSFSESNNLIRVLRTIHKEDPIKLHACSVAQEAIKSSLQQYNDDMNINIFDEMTIRTDHLLNVRDTLRGQDRISDKKADILDEIFNTDGLNPIQKALAERRDYIREEHPDLSEDEINKVSEKSL